MCIKNLKKALFCSAFFFLCSCSVSVSQLDAQIVAKQAKRWQFFSFAGKATLWEEGKELHQKFFVKKSQEQFRMVCYSGGVMGMSPTPTLSVEVKSGKIFYRTKTTSGIVEASDSKTKPLYAVLYAFSHLEEVYLQGNGKIGDATVKLDTAGNPIKIASGGVKLTLSYKQNKLQTLEIYFGLKKFLLVEIFANE